MEIKNQTAKKQISSYGLTVLVFFCFGHILLEIPFVIDIFLSIADRSFWTAYFDIIFYGIFAVIFLLIQRKMLIKNLKDFCENYKKYLPHIAISFLITIILIIFTAIILDYFGIGKSSNETALEKASKASPILEGLPIMLVGPFVEEMIFRGFIYESIRCKIKDSNHLLICLWTLIVTLLFLLNHCNADDFKNLNLLASYLILFPNGIVLTVLYEKDRNILTCMLLHCILNIIAFTN